jgi:hypothetical protein
MASPATMTYLVGDYGSQQALENEDGDCNRNCKRCHVSSHHHCRDAEPEAAPTTRDHEGGIGTELQWLDDVPPHPHQRLAGEAVTSSKPRPKAGDGAEAGKK